MKPDYENSKLISIIPSQCPQYALCTSYDPSNVPSKVESVLHMCDGI